MPAGPRVAVVVAVSLTLAAPAGVQASSPVPLEPGTEALTARAEEHIVRALELAKRGSYREAQAAFGRAAFFSPNWRPLHFNLGVVAEAQGKLDAAIREYKAFRPYATPDEALLIEQRIHELTDRRKEYVRNYRRRVAIGATIVGSGLAALAGGSVLLAIYYSSDNTYKEDGEYLAGGVLLIIAGVLAAGGGAPVLSKALKSKRHLDGLALGPTRLKWNGGAGFTLRF
jgi:tetratricopeptide (TPR) repeat protein